MRATRAAIRPTVGSLLCPSSQRARPFHVLARQLVLDGTHETSSTWRHGLYKASTCRTGHVTGRSSTLRAQKRGLKTSIDISQRSEPPSFAFAFDIDGVLLHRSTPIPGASDTLRYLHAHSIPFILLTNGGGKTEAQRVAEVSEKLGLPEGVIGEGNFVQSHTPLRELVRPTGGAQQHGSGKDAQHEKRDVDWENLDLTTSTVLVTGSDASQSRRIAHSYGFRSVVTPADLLAAHPDIWPFAPLPEFYAAQEIIPLPMPMYTPDSRLPLEEHLKIVAIFVFNDPRDWAVDIQIITDALLADRGYLGTYAPRGSTKVWQGEETPRLFFSNHDLYWSTGYHLPRFGQGAFQAALVGVWERVTARHSCGEDEIDGTSREDEKRKGVELKRTTIGKPYARTYKFAERALEGHRLQMLSSDTNTKTHTPMPEAQISPANGLKSIYMVGDNPESDIAGANAYQSESGAKWHSILVKTGVWDQTRDGKPAHEPEVIADDVGVALDWVLRKEGWKR